MTKLIVKILKTFIFTLHNDLTLHVLMSNRNLQAYIVSLNENCYLSEKANGCWPKSTYGASSFDEKSWRPSWPFAAIDHRIQAKIHSVFFFWKMAPILVLKRSPAEFFASSRRHLVFFLCRRRRMKNCRTRWTFISHCCWTGGQSYKSTMRCKSYNLSHSDSY